MRNPTRRNRNIGASNQGHGQNNKMSIPSHWLTSKTFYENLKDYQKIHKTINGHDFIFVIEKTRENFRHACSVADVEKIIEHIPVEDYGKLKLVIFRQPKRKEVILSNVWGRLIYYYEFENDFYPAIILEAVDYSKKINWPTKLSVDDQKELNRLIADGHPFQQTTRHHTAIYEPDNVRNTQLYRTLPHEFGHYVHYLEVVERPSDKSEIIDSWEELKDLYFKIPSAEKEKFAHKYADNFRQQLISQNIIPFERLELS